MPSVSPSQIPALVANTGVQIVGETWPTMPQLWRQFARVVPIASVSDYPWGHKSTSFASDANPLPRKDGHEIKATTVEQGFTPQGNIRLYARKMGLTQRDLEGETAQRVATTKIAQFQRDFLRLFALTVETHFATMFNKGAYTAGDPDVDDKQGVFNGSFPGSRDPYPTVIYDGKPWFANDHPLAFNSALTRDNYLAGVALDSAGLTSARTKVNKDNAVDNLGRQSMQMADTIIVPQELEYDLDVLLESQNKPGTAQNDRNVYQGRYRKIIHPLLSDTNGWFLGVGGQGVVAFDGGEPTFETEYDPHTKTTWILGEGRFGGFVEDFRPWVACNTATS